MSKLVWSKEEREFLARIDWASCELAELWMIGGKRNPNRDVGEGFPSPDKNPIDDLITTTPRIVAAYYGYNATDPNEFGYSVNFDPRVRKALRDRMSRAKRAKNPARKKQQALQAFLADPRFNNYSPMIHQMFAETNWAIVDIASMNSLYCPLRVWAGQAGQYDWSKAIEAKGMTCAEYTQVYHAADALGGHDPTLRQLMLDAIALARG